MKDESKKTTTLKDATPDIVMTEATDATPMIVSETVVQPTVMPTSTSPFSDIPNFHRAVTGYSTWLKVLSILLFIGAGIYAIYSAFTLFLVALNPLFILIPLFMILFTALMVFIGLTLWKSSTQIGKLEYVQTQSEFNSHTISGIDLVRKAIKSYILGMLSLIVIAFLFMIIGFAALAPLLKDVDSKSTNPYSPSNTQQKKSLQDLQDIYNLPEDTKIDQDILK
jgi:hypothetical protein